MLDASSSPRPRLLTPAFLAISVAVLAYFTADGITLPIAPRYAAGPLGADPFGVGLAMGAFSLSALLLRPLAGRLADRRGRRPLLVGGALLFAVAMLGHLVATTLPLLIVMRLLLGVAEAFVFVGALAAIADMAPEARRGEAISFFSLSLYLGIAFGPTIGETALGSDRYWLVWIVAAGMALVAAVLGGRISETRAPEPVGGAVRSTAIIHPAGVLPGIAVFAGVWGMAGFFTFLPLHALDLGFDGARLFLTVFAVVVVGSRIVGARAPDRFGARRLSGAALLFSATGLAIVGLSPTTAGLLAGSAIFALGVAFTFPALSLCAVAGVPPSERGAVIGTFSAFIDLAFGVAPVILGVVANAAGYEAVFLASAVVALAGSALVVVRVGRVPRPAGVPVAPA